MPLFKKRPLIVEAIQYQAGKAFQIEAFVGKELERNANGNQTAIGGLLVPDDPNLLLPNGWLVKEPGGQFKIYGPDEFTDFHEPAVKKRQVKFTPGAQTPEKK